MDTKKYELLKDEKLAGVVGGVGTPPAPVHIPIAVCRRFEALGKGGPPFC